MRTLWAACRSLQPGSGRQGRVGRCGSLGSLHYTAQGTHRTLVNPHGGGMPALERPKSDICLASLPGSAPCRREGGTQLAGSSQKEADNAVFKLTPGKIQPAPSCFFGDGPQGYGCKPSRTQEDPSPCAPYPLFAGSPMPPLAWRAPTALSPSRPNAPVAAASACTTMPTRFWPPSRRSTTED